MTPLLSSQRSRTGPHRRGHDTCRRSAQRPRLEVATYTCGDCRECIGYALRATTVARVVMPLLISACCSAICNCRTLLRKLQADLHCRLLLAYARQMHVGAHCFVHYSSNYASGYSDVYLMARMRLKMRIGMRLRKGSGCHQAVSLTAALPSIHIITVSTASWHRLSDAFCSLWRFASLWQVPC